MHASHPWGDSGLPPSHGAAAPGPLTFRLGKPINGQRLASPTKPYDTAGSATKAAASPSAEITGAGGGTSPNAAVGSDQPAAGPSDPRWVIAIRAREALAGRSIPEQQHEKLVRLGALLGLPEKQTRRIVEAVQEQARRGLEPSAIDLLAHLPPAEEADDTEQRTQRRIAGHAAFWSLLVLLIEIAIIFAVL